jgi:hypothetical protein
LIKSNSSLGASASPLNKQNKMAAMMLEDRVLDLLRQLGYDASLDAHKAKRVAETCRGNTMLVWEHLLTWVRSRQDKAQIERVVKRFQHEQDANSRGPSRQQQMLLLRAKLKERQEAAAALRRSLAAAKVYHAFFSVRVDDGWMR